MNTMRAWRAVTRGMVDQPDVLAAQRGLWLMLGTASTNARNGNYGEQTSEDVRRARRRLGLTGGTDTIGDTLWQALQPWFDATAWQLACRQPNGVEPGPAGRRLPLSKGMQGPDVEAAQRALWRALQGDSTNARNGVYGDQTQRDVLVFRDRYAVEPDAPGTIIGSQLWPVLTRWMDDLAVDLAQQAPDPPASNADWSAVGDQAEWAYANAGRFLYDQLRPMEAIHSEAPVRTDCSGFYTGCCQAAGVPNPNRSDGEYDGYGWTGTLAQHGHWTTSPRRGDVALYGLPPTYDHCTVYLGDGTVISFGSNPIRHLPVDYRADFAGLRTYH